MTIKDLKLNEALRKSEGFNACSWGKALGKLKKYFDAYVTEQLHQHFVEDFKLAYMPLIMNIDVDGVTNTHLAKRAGITKQGMSQIVQELEEKKYIHIQANPEDKRSSLIHLTTKGKEFVLKARECQQKFHKELQKLLGRQKFDLMMEALYEVVSYHQKLAGKKH